MCSKQNSSRCELPVSDAGNDTSSKQFTSLLSTETGSGKSHSGEFQTVNNLWEIMTCSQVIWEQKRGLHSVNTSSASKMFSSPEPGLSKLSSTVDVTLRLFCFSSLKFPTIGLALGFSVFPLPGTPPPPKHTACHLARTHFSLPVWEGQGGQHPQHLIKTPNVRTSCSSTVREQW